MRDARRRSPWCARCRRRRRRLTSRAPRASAARKASSSARRADGDPQAAVRGGASDEQSRTSTSRSSSAVPDRPGPSRAAGRNSTKLAPDGHRSHRQRRARAAAIRSRSATTGLHPRLHLVDEAQGQAAGDLLGRVEVVGQRHLVELGHQPRRADQVAEAGGRHRPRLGERAGDDERAVVVDQAERRPRRELAVGLVDDHEQPGRHGRAPRAPTSSRLDHARSGCWASTGT